MTAKGVQWAEVSDLREVAAEVDVLYQTRIQKERFIAANRRAHRPGAGLYDNDGGRGGGGQQGWTGRA